jgi:hypothetical protein
MEGQKKTGNCVPANAVRVWRGFKKRGMGLKDFIEKSGSVFVPAGVLMQVDLGLQVYVPAFPAGAKDKSDTVPDETAILFWEDQQTYRDTFKTLAERVYTLTHGALYQMPPSTAAFPELLADSLNKEQPYYLFDIAVDWMHGTVRHLAGGRPKTKSSEDFIAKIFKRIKTLQSSRPEGMDGVIICAGGDYVVYWEHWAKDAVKQSNSCIDDLAEMTDIALLKKAVPATLPAGLWDKWEGMNIKSGDCFNFQFERRKNV